MIKTTKPIGATSYKETAFGILPRSKLLKLELAGTKRGLEYLLSLIKQGDKKITPELICKLHKVSFGWIFPEWGGFYRKNQVTYSGKEAPSYLQIPELIVNLCQDLKERLKYLPKNNNENFIVRVVELLAWFQHRFVYIHPFQDYNGRSARIITSFILLQMDLPPIEIKADTDVDRKRYLTAMQNADQHDYMLLETLISHALSESFERFPQV